MKKYNTQGGKKQGLSCPAESRLVDEKQRPVLSKKEKTGEGRSEIASKISGSSLGRKDLNITRLDSGIWLYQLRTQVCGL